MSDVANLFPASPFDAAGAGAVPDLGGVLPSGMGGGGFGAATPPASSVLPYGPEGTYPYGNITGGPITSTPLPDLSAGGGGEPAIPQGGGGGGMPPVPTSTPAPAAIPTGGPTTAASAFDNLPQFPTTSEPGYGVGAPVNQDWWDRNITPIFGGLKDILKTASPYLNVAGAGYGLASALGKRGQLDPGLALAQQQAQQQLNAISNLQSTDPVPQLMANKTAARNNAAASLSRLGFKPGDTVYEQTMAGIESQYAMQTQQLQMQNQTQLQQAEAQANRNVLTEALAASKYYQDQDKALADAIGNAVGAFGKLV